MCVTGGKQTASRKPFGQPQGSKSKIGRLIHAGYRNEATVHLCHTHTHMAKQGNTRIPPLRFQTR